jgi:peroxiredoxin
MLWLGLVVGLLGPGLFFVQINMERLTKPWYVPVLGAVGAALALYAFVQRRSIVRFLVMGVLVLLAAGEGAMYSMMQLPAYQGPVAVGRPFPAFASKLADGEAFTEANLAGTQGTAMVFYRGQWCPVCMIELAQLEKRHEDFARRGVRVLVVSMDSQEDADKTKAQFPHLTVVADTERKLIAAAGVLHEKANPDGGDSAAPTTILIDRGGIVRWLFRPDMVLARLAPADLLAAVDEYLK